jgi:hypothetical protein
VLAVGLSASAALVFAAAMAQTGNRTPTSTQAQAPPVVVRPVVVRVVLAGEQPSAAAVPAPPVVVTAPAAAEAIATSGGS